MTTRGQRAYERFSSSFDIREQFGPKATIIVGRVEWRTLPPVDKARWESFARDFLESELARDPRMKIVRAYEEGVRETRQTRAILLEQEQRRQAAETKK